MSEVRPTDYQTQSNSKNQLFPYCIRLSLTQQLQATLFVLTKIQQYIRGYFLLEHSVYCLRRYFTQNHQKLKISTIYRVAQKADTRETVWVSAFCKLYVMLAYVHIVH